MKPLDCRVSPSEEQGTDGWKGKNGRSMGSQSMNALRIAVRPYVDGAGVQSF